MGCLASELIAIGVSTTAAEVLFITHDLITEAGWASVFAVRPDFDMVVAKSTEYKCFNRQNSRALACRQAAFNVVQNRE